MKKLISLLAISLLVLLTSCGEAESPVIDEPIIDIPVVEEPVVDDILTDEEIDKELEEIFNID